MKKILNKFRKGDVFEKIVELSDRPIIISSIDGKYLFANVSYLSLRDIGFEYLKDKFWWESFEDKSLGTAIKNQYRKIIRSKELSYSAEYITKNNKSVFIDWKSVIIFSKEFKNDVIVEFGRDVTEKKALESQILHLQKLDSLGTMAGGIAHEFNNILTSIIGYSSFLKNLFEKDSKERNYIDKIQRSSLGAAKLTSKLLGFARKGKQFEKLLNPNKIVRDAYDIVQKTIDRKIKIKIDLLDEKKFILADYDQIFQSLMNLILNASDAMPDGGTLTLSTYIKTFQEDTVFAKEGYTVNKGDYFAFEVKDTGIGMDEELQAKILEPFFTTKPEGRGTGLGMPMVYGVAKSHKGNLFIESELNKGTKVVLSIPLALDNELDGVDEDSGVHPIYQVDGKKTILIVDDDEQILEYLENVLTEYGYEIITAENRKETEEIIDSDEKIDLILLDLNIPKINAEELLNNYKNALKNTKIIIMTSTPNDSKVEKLKLSGLNFFLFKPFKVSNLMNLLKNIFENKEE